MRTIENYLSECVREGAFPGASWITGNQTEVFEQGTVGVLGQGLGPVQKDSIYDMASITKLFVACALMRQLEDGLIRLQDMVDYFLPSYKGTPKASITLFQLLTHTSPIAGGNRLYLSAHTKADLLEEIVWTPLRADSPERVVYTCEAFILLGEIVSAIDGEPLDAVIQKRVLDPLGMKETMYRPPAALLERIAATENDPWRGRVLRGEVHDENAAVMGGVSGNAGIFSTAADMARLAIAMLDSLDGQGFLRKPSAELMTRNYTEGRGEHRGLGWMVWERGSSAGDYMSARAFGHTGYTGTSLWVDPVYRLYAILLTNRVHPTRENTRLFRTRNIFHNLLILHYGERAAGLVRTVG